MCVLCGDCFIVLKVKGKRLSGRQQEMKRAAKRAIFARKLDSQLNYADLADANTNAPACARVCVCKLVVCPVGEEERLQRADQVVDDEDEGFSCDPEQGRRANW